MSLAYGALSDNTFTGTPGDVVSGILNGHTTLLNTQIDYGSAKDLDSILSSLSLSVLVDERVSTFDLVDRISYPSGIYEAVLLLQFPYQ